MINEIIRFLMVGVLSNIVNFFTYLGLNLIGINLFLASLIGYIVGIFISYTLGRLWVFGTRFNSTKKLLLSFYFIYIVGGIIMSAVIVFSTNYLDIDYKISWLLGAFFAIVNNFIGQKFLVFKNQKNKHE